MALGHRYDCKYPYFLLYIGFFLVKSGGLQSVQHGEQNNVGPSYPIRVLYSRSCTGSDPAPAFGPDEERTVYVRDNGAYWEVGGGECYRTFYSPFSMEKTRIEILRRVSAAGPG